MVIQPIHTAAVGVANVRFFRPPLPGPHQPWFAWEDLMLASALSRRLSRALASSLLTMHHDKVLLVETADGPTTICPHYIGQGFIGAMYEVDRAPDGFVMAYTRAVAAAMTIICRDLGLSEAEAMRHNIAAFRNSNGLPVDSGGSLQ